MSLLASSLHMEDTKSLATLVIVVRRPCLFPLRTTVFWFIRLVPAEKFKNYRQVLPLIVYRHILVTPLLIKSIPPKGEKPLIANIPYRHVALPPRLHPPKNRYRREPCW